MKMRIKDSVARESFFKIKTIEIYAAWDED